MYNDDTWDNLVQYLQTDQIISDIHVVQGTGTKLGQMGLMQRHAASFGLPAWNKSVVNNPLLADAPNLATVFPSMLVDARADPPQQDQLPNMLLDAPVESAQQGDEARNEDDAFALLQLMQASHLSI